MVTGGRKWRRCSGNETESTSAKKKKKKKKKKHACFVFSGAFSCVVGSPARMKNVGRFFFALLNVRLRLHLFFFFSCAGFRLHRASRVASPSLRASTRLALLRKSLALPHTRR